MVATIIQRNGMLKTNHIYIGNIHQMYELSFLHDSYTNLEAFISAKIHCLKTAVCQGEVQSCQPKITIAICFFKCLN